MGLSPLDLPKLYTGDRGAIVSPTPRSLTLVITNISYAWRFPIFALKGRRILAGAGAKLKRFR
jgi:hypothetical protein